MGDFLLQLKMEGLTSRLKRLSDALLYSTRDLYKNEGLDIEPNWNLIFRMLQEDEKLTITEISARLQFSHPAVVKIVNKMKENGYVEADGDKDDKRKQILKLTTYAKQRIARLEPYWEAGTEVTAELLANSPNFMNELQEIENLLNQRSYKERALEKLNP
ncbi:helix-turn-helix domain-containing protein [Algoriphagus sp. NG3]|uniref:MarR family winged helix-turn-helix transcriptional regulator n=1 Tax=Algoriphagus sp. NG3 TaxID=3097546 RepID=UPI002A818A47|nr:helix-turn-helix domain-containing protein [Algoriphagus sp. NG3]WPR75029.1 helix-turn-helix domain-containing protein [Algoriphagus sp. NG3]